MSPARTAPARVAVPPSPSDRLTVTAYVPRAAYVWAIVNVYAAAAAGAPAGAENGVGGLPSPQSTVPPKTSGTASRAVTTSRNSAAAAATRGPNGSSVGAT